MRTFDPTVTESLGVPVAEVEAERGRGPIDWMRRNLFRSIWDGVVTVIAAIVLAYAMYRLGRFVFVSGRWTIVRRNLALFMFGRYPRDELWRVAVGVGAIAAYGGIIAGYVHRHRISTVDEDAGVSPVRRVLELVGRMWPLLLGVIALLSLTRSAGPTIATFAIAAAAIAGRFVGPLLSRRWLLPIVAVGILGPIALVWFLARAVGWDSWGGLMINLFLAAAGIALSFPLGVLLALGRRAGRQTESHVGGIVVGVMLAAAPVLVLVARGFSADSAASWLLLAAAVAFAAVGYGIGRASTLPLVRIVSVTYIEFFRGVPLYVLLLLGGVALGFFLPLGMTTPGFVIRATIVITLFTAAYIAEIVRGGLQSLPRGRTEAAQALGLSPVKTTFLIVLPQALRNVIPAIVGQFISLFKDTSLVGAAMPTLDLLRMSSVANAQDAFRGQGLTPETLTFVAFVFWVGCITMSRESQRLEKKLGVGTR